MEDKGSTIIDIANLMASMGLGITKRTYLDVISSVIQAIIEQKDYYYPSMKILDRLLRKYRDLLN